MYTLTKNS